MLMVPVVATIYNGPGHQVLSLAKMRHHQSIKYHKHVSKSNLGLSLAAFSLLFIGHRTMINLPAYFWYCYNPQ